MGTASPETFERLREVATLHLCTLAPPVASDVSLPLVVGDDEVVMRDGCPRVLVQMLLHSGACWTEAKDATLPPDLWQQGCAAAGLRWISLDQASSSPPLLFDGEIVR